MQGFFARGRVSSFSTVDECVNLYLSRWGGWGVGQVGTSWTSRDKLDKSGQVGQVGTSWDKLDKSGQAGTSRDKLGQVRKFGQGLSPHSRHWLDVKTYKL